MSASTDHRPLLAAQTDMALALALGMCAAAPLRASAAGRLAALCTELRRRAIYDELMASLDPDLAANIAMLEIADRGQHFASSGQRRLV